MKKHVSEMSDKELDDFFKKLSGSPEIPFQPQDWENMKRQLDQNEKPAPLNGFKYGFLAMLLVLVFAIGFWWVNSSTELTGYNDEPNVRETLFPNNSTRFPNNSTSSNLRLPQQELTENLKKSFPHLLPEPKRKPDESTIPVEQNQTGNPSATEKKSTRRNVIPLVFDQALVDKNKALLNHFQSPVKEELKVKSSSRSINSLAPVAKKNSFSIALMVAPDISSVQFSQIRRAGRSLAINLEYFIHPKWSVNSGVVHGYKTYTSKEGYWPGYGTKHQELNGNCWILEIPVNLRYYPIQGLKSSWYLSSGVSSYFMMKERYSLLQTGNQGYAYSDEIEISGSNIHPFGVLNLGIGYERKLNQHFSLQVEPYFRLPFGGIGEGDINLKSTGILFGIKYYK